MPAPVQKPGRSRQDYHTPDAFLQAVLLYLRQPAFTFDFAADAASACAPSYWDAEVDSLRQPAEDWAAVATPQDMPGGWAWLNPPFAHIAPWVRICWAARELGARIAVLLPAGVGSDWWRDYVHGQVHVLLVNGRLTFKGTPDPYPKDVVLLLYAKELEPTYQVWNWRETLKATGTYAEVRTEGTADTEGG